MGRFRTRDPFQLARTFRLVRRSPYLWKVDFWSFWPLLAIFSPYRLYRKIPPNRPKIVDFGASRAGMGRFRTRDPFQLARTFRLMGRSPYLWKSRFFCEFRVFWQILYFSGSMDRSVIGWKSAFFGPSESNLTPTWWQNVTFSRILEAEWVETYLWSIFPFPAEKTRFFEKNEEFRPFLGLFLGSLRTFRVYNFEVGGPIWLKILSEVRYGLGKDPLKL